MKTLLAIILITLSVSLFGQNTSTTTCNIVVPNTITLDSASNKYLFLQKMDCEMDKFQMIIYNSWGSKMYSSTDQNEHWDASDMAAESFMWTIYANCPKHGATSMNGVVNVVR